MDRYNATCDTGDTGDTCDTTALTWVSTRCLLSLVMDHMVSQHDELTDGHDNEHNEDRHGMVAPFTELTDGPLLWMIWVINYDGNNTHSREWVLWHRHVSRRILIRQCRICVWTNSRGVVTWNWGNIILIPDYPFQIPHGRTKFW